MADPVERLKSHKRGADLLITFALTDDDGTPIDITLYAITAGAKNKAGRLPSPFTVTKDPDQTAPPGNRGKGTLTQTAAVTATWPKGDYDVDIRIVDPTGRVDKTPTFILPILDSSTD